MLGVEEYFFLCPYCFQRISMLLEDLYGDQSYIEDCEVCCNPIKINYKTEDAQITYFDAEKADE